jgi:hypothetical protein
MDAKVRWVRGLLLVAAVAAAPPAMAVPRVVAAHLVSSVDGGPASDEPKRVRATETVILHAVLELDEGGRRSYYSDANRVQMRGRAVAVRPMAEAPTAEIHWYKVEPTSNNLSNTSSGTFRFEAIPYARTGFGEGKSRVRADVHPTLTPDHGGGVGTMRYQLEVVAGGVRATSPGAERRLSRGAGGLDDSVHRISVRRDDTYLGYLTEMYGQPYIWASAGVSDRRHQSERLEGSDCADFMVYGARRMGRPVAYTWTGGLPKVTQKMGAGTVAGDGVVRDSRGRPVAFTRPGDLVLFTRHVGALVEDRAPLGVLDDGDVVMHTLFDSPREQAIRDTGYAHTPIEVRRWR